MKTYKGTYYNYIACQTQSYIFEAENDEKAEENMVILMRTYCSGCYTEDDIESLGEYIECIISQKDIDEMKENIMKINTGKDKMNNQDPVTIICRFCKSPNNIHPDGICSKCR